MHIFLLMWSSPPPSVYLVLSLQRLPNGGFGCIMHIFDELIIITGY